MNSGSNGIADTQNKSVDIFIKLDIVYGISDHIMLIDSFKKRQVYCHKNIHRVNHMLVYGIVTWDFIDMVGF